MPVEIPFRLAAIKKLLIVVGTRIDMLIDIYVDIVANNKN